MNKQKSNEEMFFDMITQLIDTMLINNKNYNEYYIEKFQELLPSEIIEHFQNQGKFILEKFNSWKHLIIEDEDSSGSLKAIINRGRGGFTVKCYEDDKRPIPQPAPQPRILDRF